MPSQNWLDPNEQNQTAYDDLIVSIQASVGVFSLLIAVCDDAVLRDQIIARYESELEPDIRCYKLSLLRGEPSLKLTVWNQVQSDEYLKNGGQAVVTVTGAEQLFFLKLGEERSEQEIFFGYLQWTREALGDFHFPIVLWVTNQLLVQMERHAPDFFSWRKGVFHFVSRKTIVVKGEDVASLRSALEGMELPNSEDDYLLPLEDLKALIQKIETERSEDPLLATLYFQMGKIYANRAEHGEAQNYQAEVNQAIDYFRKAADLQKAQGLEKEFATSLAWLGYLYDIQGRYSEAEPLLLQALELRRRLLGDEHPAVIQSFNNLAVLYDTQGQYSEAESLYRQALELYKRTLGDEHLGVAVSLNNLANLYRSQGRYSEAELLYRQALELHKRILGDEHLYVATSLNSLAVLYASQGRYSEAEPLLLQALELRRRLLGYEHPDVATSLSKLAFLYTSQGRYSEAEPLLLQALELRQQLLGNKHPAVAASLNNLGMFYASQRRYSEAEPLHLQALELRQQLLGDKHRDVATSLNNLASLYASQGRFREAEPLYVEALEIFKQQLGIEHPDTIACQKNLESLRAEMQ